MKARTSSFTAEQLVKAWQSSKTSEEAARKLGTTKARASGRATYLRRIGVPLKKMPRPSAGPRVDVEALSILARESLPAAERRPSGI